MSTHLCVDVFAPDYAPVHSFRMEPNIPKLLSAMEEIAGGQVPLAKRLSTSRKPVSQPQVSRWKNGQEPKGGAQTRILEVARMMGLLNDVRSEDVAAALPGSPTRKTVRLKGYVGASGEAVYYRLADEDLEEVPAPDGASAKTVAVEIKGKSLGPLLESFLVYYDDVRSPVTDDLIGELCVVGLSDDRILVKRIKRGRKGAYLLISNIEAEAPIETHDIEWAAKVTDLKPR